PPSWTNPARHDRRVWQRCRRLRREDDMGRKISRRTVLKSMGAMAAVPLLDACGPTGGGTATTTTPTLLELVRDQVDTIVLVMMENRSFNHMLGSLSLVEGRDV